MRDERSFWIGVLLTLSMDNFFEGRYILGVIELIVALFIMWNTKEKNRADL